MKARTERAVPARQVRTEEVVVNFDIEELQTPFLLRCGALIIDYIVLVSVPVLSILLGRLNGDDGAQLLNGEINNVGWLITFLLAMTNFVFLPLFTGQSIGKMLTGLRVVMRDGSSPTLGKMLVRQLIGYPLTAATAGLGFLIAAVDRNGRALHDLISGTVVVYGRRRVERKTAFGGRKAEDTGRSNGRKSRKRRSGKRVRAR